MRRFNGTAIAGMLVAFVVSVGSVGAEEDTNSTAPAAASPAAAASAAGWGHLGRSAGAACRSPDDLFLNPFEHRSAHHRPVGSSAVYSGEDDAVTASWRRGAGSWRVNSDNGWGRNVYRASGQDPRVTVTWLGDFGGLGLPVELRVPRGAANGEVSDSVVVICDDITDTAHEFYRWRNRADAPQAALHREWSLRGLGHGSRPWELVGMSASGVAGLFGLLRGYEINTPGHPVEHALATAIPPELLSAQGDRRWPATGIDGCVKQRGCTSGSIPYGALFALPPIDRGGPDLKQLDLSEPGLRLAEALRDYGTYVRDKSHNFTLPADQFVERSLIPMLNRDLNLILPYLRMVLNNSAQDDTAGGGAPLGRNCAFDVR